MENENITQAVSAKQTVVQVGGRNVTLVFNKNNGDNALGKAKAMLTNSYANSLFVVSTK